MAQSKVGIINLALQMLGQSRIGALTEDNASEMNAAYESIRDYELRANAWGFSKMRAILAASATAPAFGYAYAFPLPVNCLRFIKPTRTVQDWSLESHLGSVAILTNDGTSINLRYLGKIEDETKFDPMFVMMFAAHLARHNCERITQSNSKKAEMENRYKTYRLDARRMNAFEKIPDQSPVDEWITSMQTGSIVDSSWQQE